MQPKFHVWNTNSDKSPSSSILNTAQSVAPVLSGLLEQTDLSKIIPGFKGDDLKSELKKLE